jgi:hypothetical protein
MFTYHNKDIYSGLWANGKKHGKGTYVYNSTNCRVIFYKNCSILDNGVKINLFKEDGFFLTVNIMKENFKTINHQEKVFGL